MSTYAIDIMQKFMDQSDLQLFTSNALSDGLTAVFYRKEDSMFYQVTIKPLYPIKDI